MNPKRLAVIVLSLLAAGTVAADGLHNSTKIFTPDTEMQEADWSDPAEMARTWEAALVRVPEGPGRSRAITTAELADWRPPDGAKVPVVVYLHGCSGIWEGTRHRIRLMADMGFVVVAPASFARRKYPQSCDVASNRGSLYRGTLRIRQNDARHAVEQVRALPFTDPSRVVLMGLSEGAITAATYDFGAASAQATHRIVEGWTCNAGWLEYHGLKAGPDEPVLSLVAADDPWFRLDFLKGDCGPKMQPANGSRSVVFDGPLAETHELLEHEAPRAALAEFLDDTGLRP